VKGRHIPVLMVFDVGCVAAEALAINNQLGSYPIRCSWFAKSCKLMSEIIVSLSMF